MRGAGRGGGGRHPAGVGGRVGEGVVAGGGGGGVGLRGAGVGAAFGQRADRRGGPRTVRAGEGDAVSGPTTIERVFYPGAPEPWSRRAMLPPLEVASWPYGPRARLPR